MPYFLLTFGYAIHRDTNTLVFISVQQHLSLRDLLVVSLPLSFLLAYLLDYEEPSGGGL